MIRSDVIDGRSVREGVGRERSRHRFQGFLRQCSNTSRQMVRRHEVTYLRIRKQRVLLDVVVAHASSTPYLVLRMRL